MRAGDRDVLRPVRFVARLVRLDVHFVGDVEVGLAVLQGSGLGMRQVPLAQLGQRLDRRGRAERREPLVEVPLHAVLEGDRAIRVPASGVAPARADVPGEEVVLPVLVHDARDLGRIHDDGALLFQDRDRLRHQLRLIRVQAPAGLLGAGRRDLVVEKSAGDADPRALQGARFEEPRVIAAGRRTAGLRGRVVGIRRRPLERAEQDRRVRHGAGQGPRRVLVRRDRDDAVAADPPDRRLDGRQHVLVGGGKNRARCLGPDVAGPEARRRSDARARAAGRERGPSVAGRLPRIAPRIVGIEAEPGDRVVVGGHRARRARHPVGELRHAGLRDDDRARLAQVLRHRRLVRRHEAVEDERAAGRRHVGRVDVVLQRDRDAVQRAARLPLRPLAVPLLGLAKGLAVDRDGRVELVLVDGDSRQALEDEIARRYPPLLHRRPHLRDRGLDDRKRRTLGARPSLGVGRSWDRRERKRQNKKDRKAFDGRKS